MLPHNEVVCSRLVSTFDSITMKSTIDSKNVAIFHDIKAASEVKDNPTMFPFRIDSTNEPLSDDFLPTETSDSGVTACTFRGRVLYGEVVAPPKNSKTYIVEKLKRPTGQTWINIKSSVNGVLSYEMDQQPSKFCRLQRQCDYIDKMAWQTATSPIDNLDDAEIDALLQTMSNETTDCEMSEYLKNVIKIDEKENTNDLKG